MCEHCVESAADRLAAELRGLRDVSGKSLRELEKCTHISDSSLSRYLSGQALPPWPVVQALATTAGRDTESLRTLWSAARQARDRRTDTLENGRAARNCEVNSAGNAETRRWRLPLAVAIGLVVGLAVQPLVARIASSTVSVTDGPYFTIDLLVSSSGSAQRMMWTDTARCGNADEYRLTYDLPTGAQHRATAYRVRHADCTVKLFDGISGTGYGEILNADNEIHALSPRISTDGVSIVAYSCCNGQLLSPS